MPIRLLQRSRAFLRDRAGVTIVEYSLLLALLSLGVLATYQSVSGDIDGRLNKMSSQIEAGSPK